ncbi:hypothetical protein CYMTET_38794 [Cymbomonas tetramitiformis]|uniref:EF-hand domain-containing protein n=1 Tax=Cymbomonas tetramitiformis TaxID=36881 RepID=A0AAE0F5A5_9CHLO|nr:hypothetical protein CYMTET_38794 [Cymbomonas tetramitiformis]
MGLGMSMNVYLTEYDVEEVIQHSGNKFTRDEVASLYKRFRELDKGHKGYIAADELLNVPELSLNPLAKRLTRVFENVNFKEFVALLAAFSNRASKEDKLRFMYMMFDADGDGIVSRNDLQHMIWTLCGQSLSETEVTTIVERCFTEASTDPNQLSFESFCQVFSEDMINLKVKIPEVD